MSKATDILEQLASVSDNVDESALTRIVAAKRLAVRQAKRKIGYNSSLSFRKNMKAISKRVAAHAAKKATKSSVTRDLASAVVFL